MVQGRQDSSDSIVTILQTGQHKNQGSNPYRGMKVSSTASKLPLGPTQLPV
jgi:hypothetical protein